MKPLKIMFLYLSVIVAISGCSTSADKTSNVLKKEAGGEVVHDRFIIKPGRSYEECIELKPGMVFDYDFDSSDFVNFNIHYHAEDEVKYPVQKKGVMMGKGMIDPAGHDFFTEDQEFYCLMWDNVNDEPVKVSFSCTLKNMPRKMKH